MGNTKKFDISLVSFNAMGLFNFDSLHGIVVSRNILKRLSKTADLLKRRKADVIAFQEVHTYSALKLLKTKLKPVYPYVVYKKFLYGPRGGLVVFSKLPIERAEYINFKKRGTLFNKSIVGLIIRNGILSCKIYGVPLYVLNTHMTPNTDREWTKENRFSQYTEAQLKQISEVIKKLSSKKYEVIIAGDFNTAKNSYLYKKFIKLSQAKDIFEDFDIPTQHHAYLPKNKKGERIDYIFLFNQYAKATIESAIHLFENKVPVNKKKSLYLSDHIALKIDVTFEFDDEIFIEKPVVAVKTAKR